MMNMITNCDAIEFEDMIKALRQIKQHVFIVLEFGKKDTRIVGVYSSRDAAETHVINLCRKSGQDWNTINNRVRSSRYGIIKKTVRPV